MNSNSMPAFRRRAARALRRRGWHRRTDTIRQRAVSLLECRDPWWDWGHRVMILVGCNDGGTWSEPQPPTWWYRFGPPKRMRGTDYPRHPLSTAEVITDYRTFRDRYDPLSEDDRYEWQAIAVNQDGELILGHRYWGKPFYGMSRHEVALLRRYLHRWWLADWGGLRTRIYWHAMHAAVHQRKPRACQATPPPGSGGYDHWHCQQPRRHDGAHRTGNYVWGDDVPPIRVVYEPELNRN